MQLAVKMKQLTSEFFPLRATWPVVIETKDFVLLSFIKKKISWQEMPSIFWNLSDMQKA